VIWFENIAATPTIASITQAAKSITGKKPLLLFKLEK
jgi:hypothetical protein